MATRKNSPLPSELPPFIVERDEMARRAGLFIERAWGGYQFADLVSVYRGTLLQLLASDFVEDKLGLRIPLSTKHCVKVGVSRLVGPDGRGPVGAFRGGDGSFYVKFSDSMPASWGTLEHGTQYYVFDGPDSWQRFAVHRGTRKALIDDAIVAEDAIQPDCVAHDQQSLHWEQLGGRVYNISWYTRLGADLFNVTRNLDDERKFEEASSEGLKERCYESAEAFRDAAMATVDWVGRFLQADMRRPGKGTGVKDYRLGKKTLDQIDDLIDRIRNVVLSADICATSRPPAQAASPKKEVPSVPDADFHRFIGKLLPE